MRTWDPTRRITKGQPVEQAKKELARQYRKDPTPAERAVWELLRGRRLLGLKFRRQQLILGFIVDFFCAQHGLVLEIDGSSHEPLARQAQDEERSRILARLELRVIRVRNEEVDAARLQELIRKELNLQSPPLPSGRGGRGGEVIVRRACLSASERGPGGGALAAPEIVEFGRDSR